MASSSFGRAPGPGAGASSTWGSTLDLFGKVQSTLNFKASRFELVTGYGVSSPPCRPRPHRCTCPCPGKAPPTKPLNHWLSSWNACGSVLSETGPVATQKGAKPHRTHTPLRGLLFFVNGPPLSLRSAGDSRNTNVARNRQLSPPSPSTPSSLSQLHMSACSIAVGRYLSTSYQS